MLGALGGGGGLGLLECFFQGDFRVVSGFWVFEG